MRRVAVQSIMLSILGVFSVTSVSCKDQKPSNSAVKPIVVSFKKEGELRLKKAATDSLIITLDIEIADDAYQTQTGLMYRDSMKDNQGMLFIFPESEYRYFYMKNTKFPLDIIYLAEDKSIVSIQKDAQPMNEASLPSEAPAKYVLEVNAGLSNHWRLETGDVIEFTTN